MSFRATVSSVDAQTIPLPISGIFDSRFDPLDGVVTNFMGSVNASAATVAVSRDGKLLYCRGFGWKDAQRQQPTEPNTLFRIGGVGKVITSAMVNEAIRTGKLEPDQKVFEILSAKTGKVQFSDPRLETITIQHLLEKKGGWDSSTSFDPMFEDRRIRQALGVRETLTPWHVVRYMTQQPLQFDPGTKSVHSNFGYSLLNRVLEVTYDRTYFECVDAMICQPLATEQIRLARSSPNSRPEEEVWYPVPDNSFPIETMDGLIASAPALCRFFDHYWSNGEPREEDQGFNYWATGSLPGTSVVVKQTADGWNVVALINNRRSSNYGRDNSRLLNDITRAIEPLK